jgi:transposase-like protein
MVKQKRKSAKLKAQLVLELLRGKPIEEVSRENQVTIADLSEWRDTFLANGENGLKRHPEDSRIAQYERALGRLQMENELLKKKEIFLTQLRGSRGGILKP